MRAPHALLSPTSPSMTDITLVHDLARASACVFADRIALTYKTDNLSYRDLWGQIEGWSDGLLGLGLTAADRVGVYLPKSLSTVAALFGASRAGGVFVPLNPLLKPFQVAYILNDCNVRILATSVERANLLAAELARCRTCATSC